jgi:tRNA threonylcarbamoyladenosine biosynthesis protein TsaB
MGHMLTLALDTSSPTGSIAVLRESECQGIVSTRSDEAYSSRLFRQIQFLLDDLSLKLEEFDLFAVCAGPGSFTGLRVGLAAVKGWAEVYKKPIAAVSGLEAVAAQSRCGVDLVVPVLDARRSQLYFRKYRRQDATMPNSCTAETEECVMTPEEFLQELTDWRKQSESVTATMAIVTPEPALLGARMEEFRASNAWARNIPVEQVSSVLAPYIGQLGILRAKQGQLTDALSLDANYVRRSDAELKWKDPAAL